MKKPPSKVAHNRPRHFFQYWPGCPKGPKTEILYHQKPLIAGLGVYTGVLDVIKFNLLLYLLRLHMYKSKLDSRSFYYQEIHSRSATLTDRNLNVYRIENLGTCCWEIYSGTHFSGAMEKLGKNHDKAPKMKRARTTRVVDC